MKLTKVFTFGCSFSEYMFKVTKPYGKYISDELNVEYVHEGAGCGSNSRIFRKFFSYLRNGDINETTLVTLQFTERIRDEFWFYNVLEMDNCSHHGSIPMIENFDGGGIFKYKHDSYTWNNEKTLSRIMKDKTDYCLSEKFSTEKSLNMIYAIIEMCKYKKIPYVIMDGSYNTYDGIFNQFKNNNESIIVDYSDIQSKYPALIDGSDELDYSHISQEGHIELGKKILNKLKL